MEICSFHMVTFFVEQWRISGTYTWFCGDDIFNFFCMLAERNNGENKSGITNTVWS